MLFLQQVSSGEHVVAFEVAKALLEEFQSNHIEQLKQQIIERRQLNIEF